MNSDWSVGKIIFTTVVSFFFISIALGAGALFVVNNGKIIKGVTYMSKDISGMTKREASDFFAKDGRERIGKIAVIMQYGGHSWSIDSKDIGLVANVEEAANTAISVGHDGNVLQNFITQVKALSTRQNIELTGAYDPERLREKLVKIKAEIDTEPVNATVSLHSNGMITKTNGVVGKKLDIDPIIEELDPKLTNLERPDILILSPDEIQPYIKTSDVAAIDSVLAAYTTRYYPGDRGDNIALASSKLNDILIRKDEVFSFNTTVGRRTKAAGYKDAPVIIEGKVLEDVGGGVCQVSSTLYNAVLLAGLTPTVRAPHFFPSSYCPPGLDATVADDVLDFQFRNPLVHPVYLLASAYGSSLTVYILGTRADLNGNEISLERTGSRLTPTIHRVFSKNGTVVSREFMHTDYYEKS